MNEEETALMAELRTIVESVRPKASSDDTLRIKLPTTPHVLTWAMSTLQANEPIEMRIRTATANASLLVRGHLVHVESAPGGHLDANTVTLGIVPLGASVQRLRRVAGVLSNSGRDRDPDAGWDDDSVPAHDP